MYDFRIHAILDQYTRIHGDQSRFDIEDSNYLRLSVIKHMRLLFKSKKLPTHFLEPTPDEYLRKNSVDGTFVDHLFLSVMACYLQHDIVILPLHEDSCANRTFYLVYGGEFMSEKSGPNCPIFIGIFD